MKHIFTLLFILLYSVGYAQFAIENYSNASADQLPEVKQIADWIQFHQIDNVLPLLSDDILVDKNYLNIESSYLGKEYSRDKIETSNHTSVSDERKIVWYERNIYKISKTKLKPRYQIYLTLEFIGNSYSIVDLAFGKKKKINTNKYDKN
jgi:hypothetical protein